MSQLRGVGKLKEENENGTGKHHWFALKKNVLAHGSRNGDRE